MSTIVMTETQQYLTKEKLQEFKKELDFLRTERRKAVAENLEYAKKLGDLPEKAEYHEARQEQAEVEDRINHLEKLLKTAVIVDDQHGDMAALEEIRATRLDKLEILKKAGMDPYPSKVPRTFCLEGAKINFSGYEKN